MKTVCVHKGGPHNTISNYRSISIVPTFAKIIEKIVEFQLYNYFELNNFITESQFGLEQGSLQKVQYALFSIRSLVI